MNIGNITSNNFNLDGNGKDMKIEVYEQLIEQLQQENKRLKDNWNKLKEIAKNQSGFKKQEGLKGGVWFEIDELLDKMLELERGDK